MRSVVRESRIILILMFAMLAIFAAILTASVRADAKEYAAHRLPSDAETYSEIEKLPFKLVKIHLAGVEEGQCTIDIAEQLETEHAFSWKVGAETFFAVPCARWGHNQSWRIYVTSDDPEGKMVHFKRMMFATLDWQGQINATDVIYAWAWDESSKTVKTVFFYNGRPDCGSYYEYAWDDRTLAFKINSVRMKSVCDGEMSEWAEVHLPAAAPTLVK